MTKIIIVIFTLAACIQIIKPLGWPGLKHRSDAWKLAVFGFLIMVVVVVFTAMI